MKKQKIERKREKICWTKRSKSHLDKEKGEIKAKMKRKEKEGHNG